MLQAVDEAQENVELKVHSSKVLSPRQRHLPTPPNCGDACGKIGQRGSEDAQVRREVFLELTGQGRYATCGCTHFAA